MEHHFRTYVFRLYFLTFIVLLAFDGLWLGVLAKSFYREQIGFLMTEEIGWAAALVTYLLLGAGIVLFVLVPAVRQRSWKRALGLGASLGLVIYSVYDLTNLATLKGWPLAFTVVDIVWGTALTASVSVLTYFLYYKIFRKP